MKFIHRLGYYLGGFSIGLVILFFILSGKKTSCAYGPNDRTIKNILSKKIHYPSLLQKELENLKIDTLIVKDLIQYGNIHFSKSKINQDSCNIYWLENTYKKELFQLHIKNCSIWAEIQSIKKINSIN